MLQWSRKLAFCLSLCIYNNIIIKQPISIHSSPFGAQIDCKGYPPGSFCSLEWSRDAVFLAKSLIFIHYSYSKSNHCLTKLSLKYASLNPTNRSMSLNVDCHDMSSDRDSCYEYMYRIKALQHFIYFSRFPMATKEELQIHNDNCAVCWERMDSARKLPCSHFFHKYVLLNSQYHLFIAVSILC